MARKIVLVVDESDLFRDYLKSKFQQFGFQVETAINGLDAIAKMRNNPADLIIMDYHLSRKTCKEVLEEKSRNPNTASIPVILTAQKIDKNRLLELVAFNIRKVFMKPIKMDALYQTLTEITGARFEVDTTPSIVEAHVNDNIIFIEIAKGMNREKIDLLRFKIRELLDIYSIQKPRVLIMLSDMELSFVDGPNLELLVNTVISASGAKNRYIRILTRSTFVREFVLGHPEFAEIEAVNSIDLAIQGFITDGEAQDEKTDIISERVLSSSGTGDVSEAIEMRFETEHSAAKPAFERTREIPNQLEIAVVDDDFVIQELLKTTFGSIDAKVHGFENGREFLQAIEKRSFDLVFLDLRMPEVNGFEVLSTLHARDLELPIIVLSAVSQREAVVKAYQAGVKSYLIKPLKPDQILRKTLEILKANF